MSLYLERQLRNNRKKSEFKNINDLFKKIDFPLDVVSIDIDGVDYWVIKNLNLKFQKIFILEYNAVFDQS